MNHTHGLGADPLASAIGPITDKITAALLPRMSEIVAQASEAAEPTIRRVMVEDVLPKFGLAVVVGLVAGAAIAAAIGAHFASRRSGVRRNPPGWPYVAMRRRVAA